MKNHKPNSGQYIVYIDHSTSGIGTSTGQSTADPISLSNIMRQTIIVTRQLPKLIVSNNLKPADNNKKGN